MTDSTNPMDMSDADLKKRQRMYWDKSESSSYTGSEVDLLIAEMNRRQTHAATQLNKKLTRVSLMLAGLALTIAGLSAFFSWQDWKNDTAWQVRQTNLLQQIAEKP